MPHNLRQMKTKSSRFTLTVLLLSVLTLIVSVGSLVPEFWSHVSAWGKQALTALAAAPLAMGMAASEDIFSKCIPAIRSNLRQCGLLTVCDAAVPTPAELETIFKDDAGNYRVMEALFMHQMEMKFVQAKQYSLYDYFMANKVDLSKKLNVDIIKTNLAKIRPYILVQRKAEIRNNYWEVANGLKSLVDGTADNAGTYWRVDVKSPTDIPASASWFNAKERVFIKGLTGGGTATDTAWKVITSEVVTVSGVEKVRVVLQSQNTNSFLDSANLANPVTGLLVRGTANVSDFESFCARGPGLITSNLDEFWIETTRDAQCIDEMYEIYRDLIRANNPLFANYFDLDPVEYNKQSGEDFQKRFVNTIFFNKALANQTISTVDDLEDIETVEPGGARCIGKRAQPIGILEQHAQHKRVIDLQGGTLNLPALFEALYTMKKLREDTGAANPNVFEVAMPSQFYPAWNQAMLAYYKAQSNNMLNLYQDVSKDVKVSPLGFTYVDYKLVWPNVTIRVMFDRFFDDYLEANEAAGQESVGRMLWILDWSRIYVGILGSERVVNKTGDLKTLAAVDPTYKCVMRVPTETTALTSFTWTVICEAPQANLILHNFSGDVPEAVEESGDYNTNCQTTTTTTTTSTSTSSTSTTSTTTAA